MSGVRLAAGALLVGLLLLVGLAGPPLVAEGGTTAAPRQAPGAEHPFGTDHLGRDLLGRVVRGARTSLAVACLAVLGATLIGVTAGLVSGLGGGLTDAAVMRFVDGFNAFPQVVLVIFLSSVVRGSSLGLVAVIIAVTTWTGTARLVRAEVLSLRETDLVASVAAAGAGRLRLGVRHLLPNLVGVILVAATLRVGGAILLEASLGFLGLGLPAETPSWGRMIHEGLGELRAAWWIALFPGVAITLATVGFNVLGDGLGDALRRRAR